MQTSVSSTRRRIASVVALSAYVVFALLSLSPVWHYAGIGNLPLFAVIVGLAGTAYVVGAIPVPRWFFAFAGVCLALSAVPSVYWGGDLRIFLYPTIMLTGLFLVLLDTRRSEPDAPRLMDRFIDISTVFMIILLIGAWIALVGWYFGAEPVATLTNPDGRPAYVFWTTITNAYSPRVVRPAGIYDEPGTFSFVLCALSALRKIRGKDDRITWLLLIGGFVTVSLAHMVYVVVHVAAERWTWKRVGAVLLIAIIVVFNVARGGVLSEITDDIQRRVMFGRPGIPGDNRTHLYENAIDELTPRATLMSIDPTFMNPARPPMRDYPKMGMNPASPLVQYGLFVGWVYYAVLAALVIVGLPHRSTWVLIGLAALLLQRPSLLNLGYPFWVFSTIASTINKPGH